LKGSSPSLTRAVGFLLLVTGLMLLGILFPLLIQQGVFGLWIFMSIVMGCIGLGSLLFVGVRFGHALKSLLIALAFLLPWCGIFFLSLPGESQFLLALSIAVVAFLVYRRYDSRRSLKSSGRE
jgi:hypothetical protein